MVSLMVFLKVKGYSLKILLKRSRGSLFKEKFLDFALSLVSGELVVSPLVHNISLFSFPSVFLSLSVGLLFFLSLLLSSVASQPYG
jgi:hypothetical protein